MTAPASAQDAALNEVAYAVTINVFRAMGCPDDGCNFNDALGIITSALLAHGAAERARAIEECAPMQHALQQLIGAIDAKQLEMNSPEIGEPENDIPMHPWHEEWIYNVRGLLERTRALASAGPVGDGEKE